jgi:Xaa-Pro aminopeptidase
MTLRRPVALSLVLFASAVMAFAAPAVREEPLAFFKAHRERLIERLPADSIAVFRTTAEKEIDATTDPFRPDSDFWYLTGFQEADAVAVFRPNAPDGKRFVLFVDPKDFAKEQWTGYRAGTEGAVKEYGADEAFLVTDLWTKLPGLFVGAKSLQFSAPGDAKFREQLLAAWNQENRNAVGPRPAAEAGPVVHQLRVVKDDTEVAILRRAAVLSAEAHRAAMARVRPGVNEAVLKGLMVSHCVSNGSARMAYPPIVGSGRNSVILHYLADDQAMEAGSMVVNDTACEYGMYAADVTRSYPASGRFSPDQRAVYEIVLAAQKAGIALIKPGVVFRDVHAATVDVVVDGLMKLGILTGSREEILKERTYQKFYPHGSSHWLGLDVHDAGSYGFPEGMDRKERYGKAMVKLEPGMVLTVEPGIYIAEGSTPDKRWWNIGVRIEDDVLVTPTGSDCLSCGAPREIAEIEKAIAGR